MSACPYRYAPSCDGCRLAIMGQNCVLSWIEQHPAGASLEEIAEVFSCSRQNIEQICHRAFDKIAARRGLAEYADLLPVDAREP